MKKLNNRYRRGIAMEMAIGLMLLSVALSIILYTVAMLQIKNTQFDISSFEEKILSYQEDAAIGTVIQVNGKSYELKEVNGEKKFELMTNNESRE